MTLKQQIENEAYKLGFSAFGVALAEYDPVGHSKHLSWLGRGYQGSMEYLERGPRRRFDPRVHLPGARSVIACAMNYYSNPEDTPSNPYVSIYARGENYHAVVRDKLEALVGEIKHLAGDFEYRTFVDTSAFAEKAWARKAGIGFIGRNAMLIIPPKKKHNPTAARGSFHFLGVIITDLALEPDSPGIGTCGECSRCIDACPTDAIVDDGIVDSNLCISYHTTQNKDEIPRDIAAAMSNMVFGCDICQLVCPYNSRSVVATEPHLRPDPQIVGCEIDELVNMTERDFDSRFANNSIGEFSFKMFIRNAKIAYTNMRNTLNGNLPKKKA